MEERMSEMKKFHSALHKKGYLCTEAFSANVYCALRKKPMSITLLIGQAGTGKSFLPETLGKVLGCNVYVKQAYQGMDWDEFVQKHLPDENAKSGIKSVDAELLRAVKESKDKKVILLLDEWDKTRISSDSYFLDFLQTGRLSVSGKKYQANQDNLIIFFTSNNERDVSEALLRRYLVIEVEHLPISLIANVLKDKYVDNPIAMSTIEPTLKLYDVSIKSKMDKPATIQELCDLIDMWVTYTNEGRNPDWNELVRITITKNERNHMALQKAIKDSNENKRSSNNEVDTSIDVDYFNEPVSMDANGNVQTGFMPRMIELRKFDTEITDYKVKEGEDIFLEIRRDDESYTTAFIEARNEGVDVEVPYFVGWNTIKPNVIQRSKPYFLSEILYEFDKFHRMRKSDGVIVFIEPFADVDDVLNMIEESNGSMRKGTDDEIIFRMYEKNQEINVRWKKGKGCEFIVPVKTVERMFEIVRQSGWYLHKELYSSISKINHNVTVNNRLRDSDVIEVRSLGSTKDYLDITIVGSELYSDDDQDHLNVVNSGEAKIKETSRTTTYTFEWGIIRSWHRKDRPNYKSHITVKSVPHTPSYGYKFLCSKLNLDKSSITLFVSMDKEQFDKCDRDKYQVTGSSRILKNIDTAEPNRGYNTYALNAYDRTVFMLESHDANKLNDMFIFADQLRTIRDATMEVIC